jgi:hypothetical protein
MLAGLDFRHEKIICMCSMPSGIIFVIREEVAEREKPEAGPQTES